MKFTPQCFQVKFYWNIAMLVLYGSSMAFCAEALELSGCDRSYMSPKDEILSGFLREDVRPPLLYFYKANVAQY